VNRDPSRPARYLEITTIPLMKSLGDWQIEGEATAAGKKDQQQKPCTTP